jgi:hypothetical protein
MFNSLSKSWELVKASANVLMADKELMIFPILSSVALLVVTLLFLLPMTVAGVFDQMFNSSIMGYLVFFLFYIVQYFVIIFANTALVGAALIRLRGGDPTVRDGFQIATSRLGPILGYSLVAATVGMILKALSSAAEKNGSLIGNIVTSLFSFGWNVATFLVVPVLAVENVGPIEAIKRSTAHLKRTWGEQIVGNMALGAVFTLINLVIIFGGGALLFGILSLDMSAGLSTATAVGVGIILVILLILSILIGSTLNSIFVAAVYQYATSGQAGSFFESGLVEQAFRTR